MNKIIKNFFNVGVGTIIHIVIAAITTPIITHLINPSEYGHYSIFVSYSTLLVSVMCLGLDQALVRYFYKINDDRFKKAIFIRCISLPILITIVFIIIIIVNISSINRILAFTKIEIIELCIYTLVLLISRFVVLLLRLDMMTKEYSISNVLQKVIFVILSITSLLVLSRKTSSILIISSIISSFCVLVLNITRIMKKWKNISIKSYYDEISTKELISYGYPFILSMGISSFFQSIDKLSLEFYFGDYEVGIYSSAMNITQVFSIVQTTFNTLWVPIATEYYSENPNKKDLYMLGNRIITVIMFFIGFNVILFKDLFSFILGNDYKDVSFILPFLIFYPIMYTVSETTVIGINFSKKSYLQVIVAILSCIVNIIGNSILVPKIGCIGAAISTGLSYIAFFSLRTLFSIKNYYIDFSLKKYYLLTFITVGYALYASFYSEKIYLIVGYILCLCVLFFLYSETVIKIVNYIISSIKNVIHYNK